MIIKTEEYKKKIENIAFILSLIDYPEESSDVIDLDEILKLCAGVFNVQDSEIRCKLKHGKHDLIIKQYAFMWVAYYYGKYDKYWSIGTYMGCYSTSVRKALSFFNRAIEKKDNSNGYNHLLEIIAACDKLCKKRHESAKNRSEISHALAVPSNADNSYSLNSKQVKKIPVRSLDWFQKNKNSWLHIYNINDDTNKLTRVHGIQVANHYWLCQDVGFRFVLNTEIDQYKNASYCTGCKYQRTCALSSSGVDKPMFCPKDQKSDIDKHLFVSKYALDFLSLAYAN